jgi:hypothetical protein
LHERENLQEREILQERENVTGKGASAVVFAGIRQPASDDERPFRYPKRTNKRLGR